MTLNKTPEVSVIIPTYNRAGFITKAIESVLSQSFSDYEIIVVDDGSTDNTREVLHVHMEKIRYIFQDNSGVSRARNKGIEIAKGKWIAFLDSDDEWLPDKLAIQMEELSKRPDLCAHQTNVALVKTNGERTSHFEVGNLMSPLGKNWVLERPFLRVLKHYIFLTGLVVRRNSLLNDVGLFDESINVYEDLDLALRLSVQGPWGISDSTLAKVIRRDESIIALSLLARRNNLYNCESLVYVLNKFKTGQSYDRLNRIEQRCLRRTLSAHLFSLAMEQAFANEIGKYRENLKKSLRLNKSLKSLIKYALFVATGKIGIKALKNWEGRKKVYYR